MDVLLQIIIGVLTILGLLNESKKKTDQPYSIRNLSKLGIAIIIIVVFLVVIGIIESRASKKQAQMISESLFETRGQIERMNQNLLLYKVNTGNQEKDPDLSTPPIKYDVNYDTFDFTDVCEIYKLLYNGTNSLEFLDTQPADFQPAQYLKKLIRSGFDEMVRNGSAIQSEINRAKRTNNENILSEISYHLELLSCKSNLTEGEKQIMIEFFTELIIKYPDGYHLYSSGGGLRNLYPSSEEALIQLIKSDVEMVRVRGSYNSAVIARETGVLGRDLLSELKKIDKSTLEGHWANQALDALK